MKRGFILILAIFTIQLVNAQSVKIKKGIVYVDGEIYLQGDEGINSETPVIMSSTEGVAIFTFHIERDTKWNSDLGKDIPDNTFIAKFIDVEAHITTKLPPKKLFGKMYKNELINEDGTANEENILKFAKLYHQELPVKFKFTY